MTVDFGTGFGGLFLMQVDPNPQVANTREEQQMSTENDTQTSTAEVLKTPAEWCQIEAVQILDPDGWRGHDGRPWSDPISLDEFRERLGVCTQRAITHDDLVLEAALIAAGHTTLHGDRAAQMRAAIAAATPLIRQHLAEEIAAKGNQIAEQYQATATTHRDLSHEHGRTIKGTSHMTTAHAYRNKADGAWAVTHAARDIGAQA